MREPSWYVVQVQTGSEQKLCALLERASELEAQATGDAPVLRECFSPQYRTQYKWHGEWRHKERPLLPGYVIAVTNDPAALLRLMRRIPHFTRLLVSGDVFVPLREDERAWMDEFTKAGDRVIPMSMAYKVGDSLVVTSGPLAGREGIIAKVNRKKSLAFVELHVGGKRITARVGLGILPQKP